VQTFFCYIFSTFLFFKSENNGRQKYLLQKLKCHWWW